MDTLIRTVEEYVKDNISDFHENRIKKLSSLKLNNLLRKKNPYMYKAKNLTTPEAVVRNLASAFMSSAEETMFGDWLEGLVIFIAKECYNGVKSNAEGIDLEMDKDGCHYVVSVKSGPNWSNSSSMAKLKQNFQKARRIYHTGGNKTPFEAIEGCCYGNKESKNDSDHTLLCGQRFWEFISGSKTLYIDIIEPLGTEARIKNEAYEKEYNRMITKFTKEFSVSYCDDEGNIKWNDIVKMNSGIKNAEKK